jgi:outer membrane protein assembly factor BamD (BamD/ComL family)
MRTFIIVCVLCFLAFAGARDAVRSGRLERFLDAHPQASRNAAIEYYWGVLAGLANRELAAEYRFLRVMEKYPETTYAPLAWAERIDLLFDRGNRPLVLQESTQFLEKYSSHPKADIIRKRVYYIQNES